MRNSIYVVSHGNQWKFKCEHCREEIVQTQAEAIKIAKEHVKSLPEGTLSQILIQDDRGELRTEWTYGQDPYPPKG